MLIPYLGIVKASVGGLGVCFLVLNFSVKAMLTAFRSHQKK
jgi:hypothetical protein